MINTNRPRISQVKEIPIRGPWKTKSDGELNVLLAIGQEAFQQFITYDENELREINADIRGLRIYKVSGLKKGAIGANEWHRIRNEYTFVTKGKIAWSVQDTTGAKSKYVLEPSSGGLFTPSFILHTYEALEDDSELIVVANTLYIPDDKSTHDTYPAEMFNSSL